MSFYATVQGQIKYHTQDAFNNAVKILADGGWVKGDAFLDECEEVIDSESLPNIIPDEKVIVIPYFCHRNLARIINDLFIGGEGEVIWSSTDGCFEGGVIRDGEEEHFELRQWAKDNKLEVVEEDAEFDVLCDWYADIETEFHTSF